MAGFCSRSNGIFSRSTNESIPPFMKVLAINGSARQNGNTALLANPKIL
jgi:hypothetical protein